MITKAQIEKRISDLVLKNNQIVERMIELVPSRENGYQITIDTDDGDHQAWKIWIERELGDETIMIQLVASSKRQPYKFVMQSGVTPVRAWYENMAIDLDTLAQLRVILNDFIEKLNDADDVLAAVEEKAELLIGNLI